MRIILAGVLGAIAMFVWMAIAHMATPLATMGISKMSNEAVVLDAMKQGIGEKAGLYIFPWTDPNDPKMMEKAAALMKVNPSGLLVYQPPGGDPNMTPLLIKEFVKELIQSLIAAFLLSLTVLTAYLARAGFVALIGLFAAFGTDVSYCIWYGFPHAFTFANVSMNLIGAIVAGLAIAAVLRPRPA